MWSSAPSPDILLPPPSSSTFLLLSPPAVSSRCRQDSSQPHSDTEATSRRFSSRSLMYGSIKHSDFAATASNFADRLIVLLQPRKKSARRHSLRVTCSCGMLLRCTQFRALGQRWVAGETEDVNTCFILCAGTSQSLQLGGAGVYRSSASVH